MEKVEFNSKRWLSPEDLEGEEWRPVVGYEKYYLVSNYGRIISLEKDFIGKDNKRKFFPKIIMKAKKNNLGYCRITFRDKKSYFIHRLVAFAFIPNHDNLPCINHKDENPSNNYVDNLEWCTYSYNDNYGTHKQKLREALCKVYGKKVCVYNKDGRFIEEFPSASEAARVYGIDVSGITYCCNKKMYHCKGLVWRYKGDEFSFRFNSRCVKVNVYKGDLLVKSFDRLIDFASFYNIKKQTVFNARRKGRETYKMNNGLLAVFSHGN